MRFSGQAMDRGIKTTDTIELIDWCHRFNSHQGTDPIDRFTIGLYQIHQAIGWGSTASGTESAMASVVHFIAACEGAKARIEYFLPTDLDHIAWGLPNHSELLGVVSKAAQMLFYLKQAGRTQRSSRYDPAVLGSCLGKACTQLIRGVPIQSRGSAIELATDIMTGNL